jgi:hypothetical protein
VAGGWGGAGPRRGEAVKVCVVGAEVDMEGERVLEIEPPMEVEGVEEGVLEGLTLWDTLS